MARDIAAPSVLRMAIKVGAVPAAASVSRRGEARWESGELGYRAWVWKDTAGKLTWDLHVGDLKFGEQMSEYGGLSVPIRSPENTMSWPLAADPTLADFLQEGLGKAGQFVADRTDLCILLSSPEDVHRGNFHAWLPAANYPARLVQALILALDIGGADLESEIRSRLQSAPIDLPDGSSLDTLKSARRWAERYSAALGCKIII